MRHTCTTCEGLRWKALLRNSAKRARGKTQDKTNDCAEKKTVTFLYYHVCIKDKGAAIQKDTIQNSQQVQQQKKLQGETNEQKKVFGWVFGCVWIPFWHFFFQALFFLWICPYISIYLYIFCLCILFLQLHIVWIAFLKKDGDDLVLITGSRLLSLYPDMSGLSSTWLTVDVNVANQFTRSSLPWLLDQCWSVF